MHALGGIRIRDPSNQVAADLRIRLFGHRKHLLITKYILKRG